MTDNEFYETFRSGMLHLARFAAELDIRRMSPNEERIPVWSFKSKGCWYDSSGVPINAHSQLNNKFTVAEGGTMPLCYTDGSFRTAYKSGLLQYRFMHNSKQVSVYGYSKDECYQKRLAYNPDRKKPKKKPKKNQLDCNTLYRKWVNQWITSYKEPNVGEEYLSQLYAQFKNHIFPTFGNRALGDIKPIDLQNFLIKIESDNLRTKIASLLSESFRDAVATGLLPISPCQCIRIKRYAPPKLGALTHAEQQTIIDYVDSNFTVESKMPSFLRCLLMTGMRQGELNALQVKNIDFEHNEIIVNVAWKRKTKTLGAPKTARSVRVIPFTHPLDSILKTLVDKCNDPEERIFGWDNQDVTYRTLSKAFKSCNINRSGHITRHTFITNAFELGIPQYLVQQWAGHTEQLQTQDYLGLRRKSEFVETEISKYMISLKSSVVI